MGWFTDKENEVTGRDEACTRLSLVVSPKFVLIVPYTYYLYYNSVLTFEDFIALFSNNTFNKNNNYNNQ